MVTRWTGARVAAVTCIRARGVVATWTMCCAVVEICTTKPSHSDRLRSEIEGEETLG